MRLMLHEAGIDPRRIVCEVTEQKSTSQEALFGFVEALRANGFRIAVDDYGADDSDINRIKELGPISSNSTPLDHAADGIRPRLRAADRHGRRFSREQGIHTVFEGIEEGWQLELAEQSGASMVQGFVLARPELAPTSFSSFPLLVAEQPQAGTPPSLDTTPAQPAASGHTGRTFGRRVSQ